MLNVDFVVSFCLGKNRLDASRLWLCCLILPSLLAWNAMGRETSYVVRPHDTLYGIARAHDISVLDLAGRNDLSKNAWVYVGQRLVIPEKSSHARHHSTQPKLDPAVQRAIDKARVRPGRWKYIVIHHSGVDEGTVKGMDRYHREVRHMEHGLAYHFVIGNGHGMLDGKVVAAPRWIKQLNGGHLASPKQNTYCLGICLVGNFDKHPPTNREMRSLYALVEALMKRCHLTPAAVKTHRQINIIGTRCPGRYFPIKPLLKKLKRGYY